MKSTNASFLKKTIYVFIISMLITIPVFANWASTITQEDAKLWKMWIKLAIDGYADPVPRYGSVEKPCWRFWE
jgi:hypothetical protein